MIGAAQYMGQNRICENRELKTISNFTISPLVDVD